MKILPRIILEIISKSSRNILLFISHFFQIFVVNFFKKVLRDILEISVEQHLGVSQKMSTSSFLKFFQEISKENWNFFWEFLLNFLCDFFLEFIGKLLYRSVLKL